MRIVKPGEIYRHFKGNLYQIVAIANHSETTEQYVVYQALYGDMQVWVRPYDMFVGEVDHEKYPNVAQKYRFELLNTLAGAGVQQIAQPQIVETPKQTEPSVQQAPVSTKQAEPENVQSTEVQLAEQEDDGHVDERLLAFLDTDTIQEKIDYLTFNQKRIDDRLIDDIAAAMDLVVPQGPIDARFLSLKNCLLMKAKYECGRRV